MIFPSQTGDFQVPSAVQIFQGVSLGYTKAPRMPVITRILICLYFNKGQIPIKL